MDPYDYRPLIRKVTYAGVKSDADLLCSLGHFQGRWLELSVWLVKELCLKEAEPTLRRLVNHDDRGVRSVARVALAEILFESRSLAGLLARIPQEPDPEVQLTLAERVLLRWEPETIPAVGELLVRTDVYEETKVVLARFFDMNLIALPPEEQVAAKDQIGASIVAAVPTVSVTAALALLDEIRYMDAPSAIRWAREILQNQPDQEWITEAILERLREFAAAAGGG